MANNNHKHTFDFEGLLSMEINQKNWREKKKLLEDTFGKFKIAFEDGMAEEEAKSCVEIFNKVFSKAGLPDIGLDDLRKDIDKVATSIEQALGKINNIDMSSLKGIETSLEHIADQVDNITNKIDKGVQKSTQSAIASVAKLDKALSQVGESTKDIEESLNFKLGNTKQPVKELKKIADEWRKFDDKRIKAAQNRAAEDIKNWVQRQQAMTKFVLAYEDYVKNRTKKNTELDNLYNTLLPQSYDARTNLQNLLDRRAGTYTEFKEPWAKESTLNKVLKVLEGGIKVEDKGGDNGKGPNTKKPTNNDQPKETKGIRVYRGILPPEEGMPRSRSEAKRINGGGEYWSNSKEVAITYADQAKGSAVLLGEIKPQNALVIDAGGKKFNEFLKMPGFDTDYFKEHFGDIINSIKSGALGSADAIQAAINERAAALGHDVVKYEHVVDTMNPEITNTPSTVYSVLDDAIIRSIKAFKQYQYENDLGTYGEKATAFNIPSTYELPNQDVISTIASKMDKLATGADIEQAKNAVVGAIGKPPSNNDKKATGNELIDRYNQSPDELKQVYKEIVAINDDMGRLDEESDTYDEEFDVLDKKFGDAYERLSKLDSEFQNIENQANEVDLDAFYKHIREDVSKVVNSQISDGVNINASVDVGELAEALTNVLQQVFLSKNDASATLLEDKSLLEQILKLTQEGGLFYNSQTGFESGVVKGEAHSTETAIDAIESIAKIYDTRIHKHNFDIAAPSFSGDNNDFNAWLQMFDNIKKQVIVANKEILSFDFSSITRDTLKTISSRYSEEAGKIKEEFLGYAKDGKVQETFGSLDNLEEQMQRKFREALELIMQDYSGVMTSRRLPSEITDNKQQNILDKVSTISESIKQLLNAQNDDGIISALQTIYGPLGGMVGQEDTLQGIKSVLEEIKSSGFNVDISPESITTAIKEALYAPELSKYKTYTFDEVYSYDSGLEGWINRFTYEGFDKKDWALNDYNQYYKDKYFNFDNTSAPVGLTKEELLSLFDQMKGVAPAADNMANVIVEAINTQGGKIVESIKLIIPEDKIDNSIDDAQLTNAFNEFTAAIRSITDGTWLSPRDVMQQLLDGDISAKDLGVENAMRILTLMSESGKIQFNIASVGGMNHGVAIGKDMVYRAAGNDDVDNIYELMEKQNEAYRLGAAVPRIVATSEEGSRVYQLQTRAQGVNLRKHGFDEGALGADNEQIDRLIHTLEVLEKVGLFPEFGGDNVMYDKHKGFTMIDLDNQADYWNSQGTASGMLEGLIDNILYSAPSYLDDDAQKFAQKLRDRFALSPDQRLVNDKTIEAERIAAEQVAKADSENASTASVKLTPVMEDGAVSRVVQENIAKVPATVNIIPEIDSTTTDQVEQLAAKLTQQIKDFDWMDIDGFLNSNPLIYEATASLNSLGALNRMDSDNLQQLLSDWIRPFTEIENPTNYYAKYMQDLINPELAKLQPDNKNIIPKNVKVEPVMDDGAIAKIVKENAEKNPPVVEVAPVIKVADTKNTSSEFDLDFDWDERDEFFKNLGVDSVSQTTDNSAAKELENLKMIQNAVENVTKAVYLKTSAFTSEEEEVQRVAVEEAESLGMLEHKILSIKSTLEGLLNNIRTGESDISAGLNNIVVTVNYPEKSEQPKNAPQEPWAREGTLQTVKPTLDNISTSISNFGSVNISNTGSITSGLEGKLTEIKNVLTSIDDKIAKGGVITTKEDAKRQRNSQIKSLTKDYEKLGELAAKFDETGNLETKARLDNLREEIKEKRKSLQLSIDENAELRKRYSAAFDAQKRLLDAARAQREINRQKMQEAREEAALEKEAEKEWKKKVKDAQRETGINAADSTYRSTNNTVLSTIGSEGVSADIEAKAKELDKQNKILNDLRNDINTKGIEASEQDREALSTQIVKVKELKSELDGYLKIHEKYSGSNATQLNNVDTSNFGAVGTDKYWNSITQAIKQASEGRVHIKGMNADTGELTGTTKIAANTFAEWSATVDPITGKLSVLRTGIKKTETLLEAITRKTKEIFTYFSGSSIIFKVFNELRRGIQYVREIDLALTELKKVTDATEESYDKFLKTAAKTGERLGSTISAVTEATATFAKLGYSMQEATEMAEAAIVYKNVGDNIASTEDAADSIISTMKGFGLEASESMAIVDKFNEVGE